MGELKIYKVVEKWRKPLSKGISIEDVDKYLNYEDVKHWFYVKGFIDNWFYIAVYDSLIVGYYFRNVKQGGKVEVLPNFRKNGYYGYLDVYKKLLYRLKDKFPKNFHSTVSLLNIPSLSSHFKNSFIINNINYYENKRKHFIINLISKVVLGKDYKEDTISKRKIELNLYYEFKGSCYKYNIEKNYDNIKKLFINHNRELKCFVLINGEVIYLDKIKNKFKFPDNFKYKFNLYAVKYKLIIPNKKNIKKKKKEEKEKIKKESKVVILNPTEKKRKKIQLF